MASKAKKASSGSLIQLISWCLQDTGGASVNAIVTTLAFMAYLTSANFGNQALSSQAVSIGMTVAGITVALTAPITRQRIDRCDEGTFWLMVLSTIVVACLTGVFLAAPHPNLLRLGMGLPAVMIIFFGFATVNYYAILPRIFTPENTGWVFGIGWVNGYFGEIILLTFLSYGFITKKNSMGINTANDMGVRVAMLVPALWLVIVFAPTILIVQGCVMPGSEDLSRETLWESYRCLFRMIVWLFHRALNALYFLVASIIFRDRLPRVFTFGSIITRVIFRFSTGEIIPSAVTANITADVAVSASGVPDDRIGPKEIMLIPLIALIGTYAAVFFLHDWGKTVFWTFGLFMTTRADPAQSVPHSSLSRCIPSGHEGEVSGLYQTTGRSVIWLASLMSALFIGAGSQLTSLYDPVSMAVTTGVDSSVLPVHEQAQYWGILGVASVLLLSLLLLLPVKDTRPGTGGAPAHRVLVGIAGETPDSGMAPCETEENQGGTAVPNKTIPKEATTMGGAKR